MKNFNPNSFNYEDWESHHVGCAHIGNHSITDIEIYKINGQLWFMTHDDPDFVTNYEDTKRDLFGGDENWKNYDGQTLDEQLKAQGLL